MINKERNYGIDLLRIVAMFMVVILHVLGRGGILEAVTAFSPNYYISWFLEIASFGAVNCYAAISGYVGYNRKIKYSNLVYIIFCAAFYLLVLSAVGYFTVSYGDKEALRNSLLHMRVIDGWWYLKAYFVAFLIFPYINLIVEKIDRKKSCIMLSGMFIVFSVIPAIVCSDVFLVRGGYSPWWLLIMYFVGAVMRKYDEDIKMSKKKCVGFYILFILLAFLIKTAIDYASLNFVDVKIINEYLLTYVSPLIVLSSVFLVMFFRQIKINRNLTKIISYISPLTFGVYLIHTQYYVWEYLHNRFVGYADMLPLWLIIHVIFTTVIIYLGCSAIDLIRRYLFKLFKIQKISEYADKFSR